MVEGGICQGISCNKVEVYRCTQHCWLGGGTSPFSLTTREEYAAPDGTTLRRGRYLQA